LLNLPDVILRQYRAPLAMLRKAIEACPEELWLQGEPNRFWQIAYHSLFYMHFYLSKTEADFVPWGKHRPNSNLLSVTPLRPDDVFGAAAPYSKAELLEYAALCSREIYRSAPLLDLEGDSGFHWLPFDKLELQFYNIRHLSHHTGQLLDRLRTHAGIGIGWVR
jgi:hypothetical protein